MKGFNYIFGNTLLQVLMKANEAKIKKEEFVCITQENDCFCLVYYDNTGV